MPLPHLLPRFHSVPAAPPADAGTCLDVRVGAGRPARYALSGDEFRVGGAAGCDLKLAGANLPAVVCRVTRTAAGGLTLHRADPAFPILVNGTPAGAAPVALAHGDRVAVGSVDVTVHVGRVHLRPQWNPPADAHIDALARQRADLAAECDQLRAEAARLAAALPDLDARQAELEAFRDELAAVRGQLHAQYAERRDQLAEMQAVVTGAADSLRARQEAFDRAAAARSAELDAREQGLAAVTASAGGTGEDDRAADVAARSAALAASEAELTRRAAELDARAVELAAREADADTRYEELSEAAGDLEAHAQASAAGAERVAAAEAALAAREAELAARLAAADRDRAAAELLAEEVAGQAAAVQARGDAVTARAAGLDAQAAALAARAAELDAADGRVLAAAAAGADLAARAAELSASAAALAEREAAVERREAKLREVGRAVAAAKRDAAAAREGLATDRAALASDQAAADAARADLARRQDGVAAGFGALRAELAALGADADAARVALAAEADAVARREAAVAAAAAEHRLAVAGFKAHVLAWQADQDEAARRAAEAAAARAALVAAVPPPLAPPADPDRTLSDLRAWYRRRLRDLAGPPGPRPAGDPPDPGDRHLADSLRHHGLADPDTAAGLLAEAAKARRPLRSVLLASGAVTLYQLALIESGNLAALALGRLRVIDRVRVTPREVIYRVSDPAREDGPDRGVYLLRHLSEAEMDDAVRPDEFRQRFAAARDAAHLHLARVVDVLEVNGRPAALCEQPAGAPSGDWPADAAVPGVWVRLVESAAAGLAAAHRHGLAHGRLSGESFVLTPAGELKVVGVGEPMWLATGVAAALDPTPAADLRALGPVAFGWAQLAQPPGKRRTRGKAFPEPLLNVVRRLESDPETPMADTAAGAAPYADAAELLADLGRLAAQFPCPEPDWDRLVGHAAAAARPDGARLTA